MKKQRFTQSFRHRITVNLSTAEEILILLGFLSSSRHLLALIEGIHVPSKPQGAEHNGLGRQHYRTGAQRNFLGAEPATISPCPSAPSPGPLDLGSDGSSSGSWSVPWRGSGGGGSLPSTAPDREARGIDKRWVTRSGLNHHLTAAGRSLNLLHQI